MSDPLALFPFALAAGGGAINGVEAQRLVAAGVTLLQRSATLVRALSGRRSAILLPAGPEWLLALAASDGRAALLIAPESSSQDIASQLVAASVGAVFTIEALASKVPADFPVVLLDGKLKTASVLASGRRTTVDLGSHHGLTLLGARDVDGLDEECLVSFSQIGVSPHATDVISHREILQRSRDIASALSLTPMDRVLAISLPGNLSTWLLELLSALSAPLLRGASLTMQVPTPFSAPVEGTSALASIATSPYSVVMASAEFWSALAGVCREQHQHRLPNTMRQCAVIGPPPSAEFVTEFVRLTGIPLHAIHATICNRDAR